jgi:predicted acyltransferase
MARKNKKSRKNSSPGDNSMNSPNVYNINSSSAYNANSQGVEREPQQASALDHAVIEEKIRLKANRRLASLDALRGLNMLFIIGLASLIAACCSLHRSDFRVFGDKGYEAATAVRQFVSPTVLVEIKKQMSHVVWNGLRHHDTIFPLFLFLAGVSFPFSYRKQLANGRPAWRICLKAIIRGFSLFLAGFLYSNAVRFDFPEMRFMGVLQHIGLAWMFAAFIYMACWRRVKLQVGICAGVLILYWLVVALIPSRDVAPDSAFTASAFKSRAAQLFTVRAYDKYFDASLAVDANGADAAAAETAEGQAEGELAGEQTDVAEPVVVVRHSLKGLIAGMFDEQPLPEFGSASYPEVGTVDHNLLPEGCVVNYIDRQFVPGKLYHDRDNHRAKMKKGEVETTYDPGIWRNMRDPEGLASTFPAIVTALLGMLFGGVLRADDLICSKSRKLRLLFGYGALLVLIGFAWHLYFPINKNLWNSSFVCFVGGCSAIAMAISYLLIDVWKMYWLGFPFVVVGMNSLGIYMITRIVNFTSMRNFFFADAISRFVPNEYPDPNFVVDPSVADPSAVEIPMIACDSFQNIATICAGLIVSWVFLFWLYRKRIFFKL